MIQKNSTFVFSSIKYYRDSARIFTFPFHSVLIFQWRVRVRNNDHGISTGRYLYGYGFFLRKFGTGKVWVNVIFEFVYTE